MPDRSLLPRRPLVIAAVVSLASTIALGALLGPGGGPTAVDTWAWDAAQWSPLWQVLNYFLANRAWQAVNSLFSIGTPGTAFALGVGLALVHWWRGERRVATACLLGPLTAIVSAGAIFKPLFDRTLGSGGLAYPSTHTAATLASGAVLVVLGYRSGGRRRAFVVAGLWALVTAVLVLHLLEQRLHYFTDVIGGAGVGIGTTLLVTAALLGQRSEASARTARTTIVSLRPTHNDDDLPRRRRAR